MKVTSWVVVDKQTGKAVMETFNRATADAVNLNKFDVLPTLEYLQKLNRDLSMERKSNPTKKFSPAQIAAQKLFAERARAGTLGKGKRKANPVKGEKIFKTGDYVKTDRGEIGRVSFYKDQPKGYANVYRLIDVKANDPYASTFLENGNFINGTRLKAYKQTLSQKYNEAAVNKSIASSRSKISASEGKTIKRLLMGRTGNPDKAKPRAYVKRASQATGAPPSKRLQTRRKMALKAPAGYFPNPKVKYTNRAKDLKGEQRVGYSVHRADAPSYLAIAWFSKKSDAVQVAQEASDRTGKQLAVTRVQNHFGPL